MAGSLRGGRYLGGWWTIAQLQAPGVQWNVCRGCASTTQRPRGYWLERENRMAMLRSIGENHGVKSVDGWKRVTVRHVREAGGLGMLMHYNGSLFAALQDLYGQARNLQVHECRAVVPQRYWDSLENQRNFLQQLAAKLDIKKPGDWAKVSYKDMNKHGGRALLAKHGNSLLRTLQAAWPEAGVLPHHMRSRPRKYWASAERRRQFLDELAEEFGVEDPEDWRLVGGDVISQRAAGLVGYYGSVQEMIKDSTVGSRMVDGALGRMQVRRRVPSSFWDDKEHVRSYLHGVASELDIEKPEDWYRVSQKQLENLQGAGLLRKMPLADALRIAYPDEQWDAGLLSARVKKTSQRCLLVAVDAIFAMQQPAREYT